MKKLKFLPIVLALAALFCIPAFAVDECLECGCVFASDGYCARCGEACSHIFIGTVCDVCGFECVDHDYWAPDGYGFHTCLLCAWTGSYCVDVDENLYCDICDEHNAFVANGGCEHLSSGLMGDFALLYDDAYHYFLCLTCGGIFPLSLNPVNSGFIYHTSPCSVCQMIDNSNHMVLPLDHPAVAVLACPYVRDLQSGVVSGFLTFHYDDTAHYLRCSDCGLVVDVSLVAQDEFPHTAPDCAFCSNLSSGSGILVTPLPTDSPTLADVFSAVTDGVTSAVSWVAAFAVAVTAHPLLLAASILGFVGLGIAILRRLFF